VDIDPGAVEIAKLRLWLSLVVDEDDIKNIKPLPNLDYRIMQGNSLISEFMSINFDSDKEQNGENLMFKDETDELIEQFQQKKDEFLNESNVSRKSKLKEEVDELLVKIFETKLRTQKADYFNRLKNIENKYSGVRNEQQREELIKEEKEKLYKESGFDLESAEKQLKEFTSGRKIKPFFLWDLYFSEVFHKKGGFDVVIANPPYLGIKDITWDDRRHYETIFKTATGRFDSYSLFIEKAMQIKSSSGTFAFIIPGKFLNNKQFVIARKIICKNHGVTVVKIDKKVFEEAQVDSVIVENYMPAKFSVPIYRTSRFTDQGIQPLSEVEMVDMLKDPEVIFRLEINTEIDQLISKIRGNTFKVKEIGEVKDGIVAGAIKDILFTQKKKNNDSKKLYFGKHITRYNLNKTDVWVNYKPDEMMKEEVKRQGSKRPGLWMRDKNIFEREKIIYRKVGKEIVAAYGPRGTYYEQTIHSVHLTDKRFLLKYLLGLFNSKLFEFYYQITNSHSGNIFPQVRISSIENLPIKLVDKYSQDEIDKFVKRILVITKEKDYPENPKKQAKVKALEREIDQLVYKLYSLTEDEIAIIEGEKK
jgi:hypothetical protein